MFKKIFLMCFLSIGLFAGILYTNKLPSGDNIVSQILCDNEDRKGEYTDCAKVTMWQEDKNIFVRFEPLNGKKYQAYQTTHIIQQGDYVVTDWEGYFLIDNSGKDYGFGDWLSKPKTYKLLINDPNIDLYKTFIFYNQYDPDHYVSFRLKKNDTMPATQDDKIRAFIKRFYNLIMDREPDKGGWDFWTESLKNHKMSAEDIATFFFFSPEFKNKNVSDEEFIKKAYNTLLNREPDKGGYQYWINEMASGLTKRDLIKKFVNSQEFKRIKNEYGII